MSENFTMWILGAGRLGTAIAGAAAAAGVSAVSLEGGMLRSPEALQRLRENRHEGGVLVDASVGESAERHLEWALSLEIPLVLGTTGHGLSRQKIVDRVGDRVGVLLAPNFAPGALLLGRVAEALGHWTEACGHEAFLEERHHSKKRDAPSGTALWLEERFHAGGGGGLPISATRAGTVTGAHVLGVTGPGELLEFRHMSLGREVYGAGAVAAARYIEKRRGVHTLEDWAREMFPWPTMTAAVTEITRR